MAHKAFCILKCYEKPKKSVKKYRKIIYKIILAGSA